jgi:hypothetical protein
MVGEESHECRESFSPRLPFGFSLRTGPKTLLYTPDIHNILPLEKGI